jgi:hypothetical protein
MRFLFLSAVATVGLWILCTHLPSSQVGAPAVIGRLRDLHGAQIDYYTRHGRYAADIAELDPELATGEKLGYRFRVTTSGNSYSISAVPVRSGAQTFYSDETLVIRESRGKEPANAASPEWK